MAYNNLPAPQTPPLRAQPLTDDLPADIEPTVEPLEIQQPTSVFVREIVETALLTLLIFWVVHTMTGRFRIEGQSMEPTLQEPQYVLINKLSYLFDPPERGDIIVLHFPGDPERNRDFIKRIVAVPGDHIEIYDNAVYVNGVILNEPYISAPPNYTEDEVVPEGHVYVLGDNRNNSHDSHSWSVPESGPFLPYAEIVGKAWFIYWSPSDWSLVPHHAHPNVPDNTTS